MRLERVGMDQKVLNSMMGQKVGGEATPHR
jgi:hypothetical protein